MSRLSLNIGLRALLTAQSALDTVGHNISNANTLGFSRQTLRTSAARPLRLRGLQFGGGVQADAVMRTVDDLLSRRIVAQLSSVRRLDSLLLGMSGVEALFGEPGGVGIGALLDGFFETVAELSTNPQERNFQTGMVQAGVSLTSQFHQLADELDLERQTAANRIDAFTAEVNLRGAQIAELNQEIAQVEAAGVSANDLRDERDLALRELAEQINITYHEDDRGYVRVLVQGQLLVGASTSHELTAQIAQDGDVTLFIAGGTQPVQPRGGEIGGLIAFSRNFVPTLLENVNRLARSLILEVNRAHSTGIPPGGGFDRLVGEHRIEDQDGDGDRTDELLSNSGLPFDIQNGVLYVNIVDEVSGALRTTTVEIDAARTSVGDFLAALNAVPELSARLDSLGRLEVTSTDGHTFDFSRRLDLQPDTDETFGSGRASLGSANQGPFDLLSGSTLTVTGPVSPVTVTFDPADFADMSEASAAEVAAAINAEPGMTANQLRAVAVDGRVFLQSKGSGASQSFVVTGGTASGALGFVAATVVDGHDSAVNVQISGNYTGSEHQSLVFRPNMDGQIGTTPGLTIEVLTSDGLPIATLDVGPGYIPGNVLTVTDGVGVSFSFGHLSASDNDTFTENLVADSDSSDVLVALGLNSFLVGTDARSIAVRDDIITDPDRIATSASGAAGDNGALLELMALQQDPVGSLDGTFNEFYGTIVGGVGFEVSSTRNSLEVEEFISTSLFERREQISGVNIDEELVNMIQAEQAFGAASRFIQVINTLNDEILNLL